MPVIEFPLVSGCATDDKDERLRAEDADEIHTRQRPQEQGPGPAGTGAR